ncbi:MAG: hypothetical protein ACRC5M_04485 [Anaeroplasmataceae bacterium]
MTDLRTLLDDRKAAALAAAASELAAKKAAHEELVDKAIFLLTEHLDTHLVVPVSASGKLAETVTLVMDDCELSDILFLAGAPTRVAEDMMAKLHADGVTVSVEVGMKVIITL